MYNYFIHTLTILLCGYYHFNPIFKNEKELIIISYLLYNLVNLIINNTNKEDDYYDDDDDLNPINKNFNKPNHNNKIKDDYDNIIEIINNKKKNEIINNKKKENKEECEEEYFEEKKIIDVDIKEFFELVKLNNTTKKNEEGFFTYYSNKDSLMLKILNPFKEIIDTKSKYNKYKNYNIIRVKAKLNFENADGSCLFHSTKRVLEKFCGIEGLTSNQLREESVSYICKNWNNKNSWANYTTNPYSNNDPFKNKEDYEKHMLEKDENGKYFRFGAMSEIAFFHYKYKVNIYIYNTNKNIPKIVDEFGKNKNYDKTVYLYYTGNHYNSIIL
jgi:hypothetical protein